ncbi:NAD-dependent epimerase/dehydratase family protein [Mesorhizobium sp. CGMCC 1.15528]|uniref:NAD-dependent epimerase/dehydratase family protein n=1 Tax=Mesorhizobium zhangyense TaxID=1776730 RepID=A0A7C9V9S5_9HYPH|nr:NAD-dependent epimerase/dehydratase family protein [Mesorhizobium zhangyense]NGN40209.1 NAD-dependent epimerase/dehydratase family protein [Mesorhizobium zhangyense]
MPGSIEETSPAPRPNVGVTGASGFVGGALVSQIAETGHSCTAAYRGSVPSGLPPQVRPVTAGDLSGQTDWSSFLRGLDVVIHAAARVHILNDRTGNPLTEYRRVNVEGTLALARQAAAAGVKRFVFLSTIKVNGEETAPGQAFRASDRPHPSDPYAISKLEAETGLVEMGAQRGMEVVIIRPPLVYGPGVKANFLSMMRWVDRGVPLPLGAVNNRRTLVALPNLVDLVLLCAQHRDAAGKVILAGDGEDLSTSDLLRRLYAIMGRSSRLISVPPDLLSALAGLLGKGEIARRLCGSLRMDVEETRRLLDWTPPVGVDEGLRQTVEYYRREQRL